MTDEAIHSCFCGRSYACYEKQAAQQHGQALTKRQAEARLWLSNSLSSVNPQRKSATLAKFAKHLGDFATGLHPVSPEKLIYLANSSFEPSKE
jgi:hypothetical protein